MTNMQELYSFCKELFTDFDKLFYLFQCKTEENFVRQCRYS